MHAGYERVLRPLTTSRLSCRHSPLGISIRRNDVVGYRSEWAEITILTTLSRTGDAISTEGRAGRDGED